jgi:hypothetical protein
MNEGRSAADFAESVRLLKELHLLMLAGRMKVRRLRQFATQWKPLGGGSMTTKNNWCAVCRQTSTRSASIERYPSDHRAQHDGRFLRPFKSADATKP